MALVDELGERVSDILRTGWNIRDGRKVPLPGDIQLGGDAVSLYGALLYADIANSTQMVETFTDKFSARVFQSFVYCCCRIVRKHGGVITSFDGDRVMGAFIGQGCEYQATVAALKIKGAVEGVINPLIDSAHRAKRFRLKHAVGVDASDLLVVSTGMREFNDLVWVGRAANYAAKMSGLRLYSTYITKRVHLALAGEIQGWEWWDWKDGGMKILATNGHLNV